jgi:MFS family permease
VATEAPPGAEVLQNILTRLLAENSILSSAALALLLVGVFAIAASTMSSSFAASLCTIRYDVLPICWPDIEPPADATRQADEFRARRVTLVAGMVLLFALIAAFFLASASSRMVIGGNTFLAGVFAVCCAQVSLAPLLFAPILRGAGGGTVSPSWAMAVLAAGMVGGAIAVTGYIATGHETWLWAAVPLCLVSGLLVFAVARSQQDSPCVTEEK